MFISVFRFPFPLRLFAEHSFFTILLVLNLSETFSNFSLVKREVLSEKSYLSKTTQEAPIIHPQLFHYLYSRTLFKAHTPLVTLCDWNFRMPFNIYIMQPLHYHQSSTFDGHSLQHTLNSDSDNHLQSQSIFIRSVHLLPLPYPKIAYTSRPVPFSSSFPLETHFTAVLHSYFPALYLFVYIKISNDYVPCLWTVAYPSLHYVYSAIFVL